AKLEGDSRLRLWGLSRIACIKVFTAPQDVHATLIVLPAPHLTYDRQLPDDDETLVLQRLKQIGVVAHFRVNLCCSLGVLVKLKLSSTDRLAFGPSLTMNAMTTFTGA